MAPLRFFLDLVSPYTYIAWRRIHPLAARFGREVEPVPFVLGAVLQARGARAKVELPWWRAYMLRDVLRLADLFGVPIAAPHEHPFRSLLALRLASLPMAPATRHALLDDLFAAAWERGEPLAERAVVERIAAAHGLSVADAEESDNKLRLRAQTDEALALGLFGAPSIVVDGELFFGNDSFPHLERFLAGTNPATAERIAAWKIWA